AVFQGVRAAILVHGLHLANVELGGVEHEVFGVRVLPAQAQRGVAAQRFLLEIQRQVHVDVGDDDLVRLGIGVGVGGVGGQRQHERGKRGGGQQSHGVGSSEKRGSEYGMAEPETSPAAVSSVVVCAGVGMRAAQDHHQQKARNNTDRQ